MEKDDHVFYDKQKLITPEGDCTTMADRHTAAKMERIRMKSARLESQRKQLIEYEENMMGVYSL